jgi:hypothetical protein
MDSGSLSIIDARWRHSRFLTRIMSTPNTPYPSPKDNVGSTDRAVKASSELTVLIRFIRVRKLKVSTEYRYPGALRAIKWLLLRYGTMLQAPVGTAKRSSAIRVRDASVL